MPCVTEGGWLPRTRTHLRPSRAAAAAVRRAWLLCAAPLVTSVVAPARSASAQVYCSLRILLPPPPRLVRSSRLIQRSSAASVRRTASRGARSSGVGQVLSSLVKPFASQATLKWILDNRLPTPGHRRYFNAVSEIDRIVFRIIAERRASGSDEGDLLSMLLEAQDEDGSQMTDAQLRDEVMTLFLAGHETTALALSWSWYLLASNPETEKKFHAELAAVLGGRTPDVSDLPQLKYTEMIAKETMRLYPPAYAVGREAIEETELGGFRVPKGTQVFAFQWVTHRDPRFFDEPAAFKPERWANGASEQLPKYAYFPFGGGPRQCIGNYFAMMEIVLLLATIGQRFRFSMVEDHEVEVLPVLSLRPKNGIKVKLFDR